MMKNKKPDKKPFWVDNFVSSKSYDWTIKDRFVIGRWLFRLLIMMVLFIIAAITMISSRNSPILWFFAFSYLIIFGSASLGLWRYRKKSKVAKEIQERARQQTNAIHIGSVIHVAGHPTLERDQQLVLSISNGLLSFYSYDSSIPLDTIEISDIKALELIGYDNERRPIRGVVDGSAQVLEINFERDSIQWTCKFRKMRPVKPVDWYHAIQQAKFTSI